MKRENQENNCSHDMQIELIFRSGNWKSHICIKFIFVLFIRTLSTLTTSFDVVDVILTEKRFNFVLVLLYIYIYFQIGTFQSESQIYSEW